MEDSLVHNFSVKSHMGEYEVVFDDALISSSKLNDIGTHYIVDKNVAKILGDDFCKNKKVVIIDATEDTKSYHGIEPIISQLFEYGMRRDSILVSIGGGITQDITSFIASTFMRGVKWVTVPTTLLSQSDSCIGSKSSINFKSYKNLLGTFTPPHKVYICKGFLETLSKKDFKSGIGEIIKLFLLDSKTINPSKIDLTNIQEYTYHCLQIKKRYIEEDEFDFGARNLLNYGHCFGHGIESASNFAIPHGIAITIGMDIANRLSLNLGMISQERYLELQNSILPNYAGLIDIEIDFEKVFEALSKDKKNTSNKINVVLPQGTDIIRWGFINDEQFKTQCKNAISQITKSSI